MKTVLFALLLTVISVSHASAQENAVTLTKEDAPLPVFTISPVIEYGIYNSPTIMLGGIWGYNLTLPVLQDVTFYANTFFAGPPKQMFDKGALQLGVNLGLIKTFVLFSK